MVNAVGRAVIAGVFFMSFAVP
ncbi:MAG: hypothetical protein RL341_1510, partial [Pseudomonadota bacterium]